MSLKEETSLEDQVIRTTEVMVVMVMALVMVEMDMAIETKTATKHISQE